MTTTLLHPGVSSLKSAIKLGILGVLLSLMGSVYQPERLFAQENPVPVYDATEEELGGIFALIDGKKQAFLLEKTTVNAQISGNVSRVEVTQTFTNPFADPLEAIYQFPLPDDAAVDDMEIRIGSRVIRGVIKPREEAQQIYQQAKEEGKTAGLLEEDRPNLFSQSLANILPGEKIEVVIRYSNSLIFSGGNYEFRFPTLVDDRYDSTALGSTVPKSPLRVSVSIDAGVPIQNVTSPSHSIEVKEEATQVQVSLSHDVIPDKDLILRYQVSGADTQTTVLTQKNEQGGHFAIYLIPALDYTPTQIVPKDVVFLVDTSGSQSGSPIAQSKELMRQFIKGLNAEDTFAIVDFSDTTRQLAPNPLANSAQNRAKALAYIETLDANGGTELMRGLDAVLAFPPAPEGRLRSIVMLTDGLIGDDEVVIGAVQDNLQRGNRLYTFGVGDSTNHFLVNRLAEIGRGTAKILPPNEPATEVAKTFFEEINNPVLTNIEVTWIGSGEAPEIYPQAIPDLFTQQPLVLFGRQGKAENGQLRIQGIQAGGKPYEKTLSVSFDQVAGNQAIAQLWGRARIKDLMNQIYRQETPELKQIITTTALDYRLLSKYTAFVAVSEEVRVNPEEKSPQEDPEILAQKDVRVPALIPTNSSNGQFLVAQAPNNNNTVPEPGQIVGNGAALGILLFLLRKPLKAAIFQGKSKL